MANALACGKCGNTIASDRVNLEFDGNCPWCLAAFALGDPPQDNPASTPLVPGAKASTRLGKYLLTEKLGTGGMGEVWKALDTELNRWVALKFLKDQDPRELARFTREAHMAAKLAHPNIAAVHEIGEAGGRHFIAMQCIEGRTLETFPRNDRRLLVRLCLDAARALDHAHRHGVIHRDVKPGNLMVEETEEGMKVVVLDFGLARSIEGGEKLSVSGSVVGTPQYMSPEQARAGQLDERTDVYSLGVTMYEIFTGKAPFEGGNVYEILKKIENDAPIAPRKIKPEINEDLQTIILKCLEKHRERRYAGAKDLAHDLRRFLNHEAVLARPPSAIYRLRMQLAKRKAVAATAGIAATLLAVVLGWWLLVGRPHTEHLRRMADGRKLWEEARVAAITGGDTGVIRMKTRAAREQFEEAIREREEAVAHLMRGRCLALEGDEDGARAAFERAHELDPDNADARVELAKALMSRYRASRGMPLITFIGTDTYFGDLAPERPEERRWRERAVGLLARGETAPAHQSLLKGLVAMGRGDFPQAARELAVYTKAERWDAQAMRLEADCRFQMMDFEGAIEADTRSLNLVPRVGGFNDRANAKYAKGLLDDAIADFNKALELNPNDSGTYLNRGNVKHAKGLYNEAITDFTKAIELDPKSELIYTNRANTYSALGLHDEAIADCTKAILMNPKHANAFYNRGNAKHAKGLHDKAIEDFNKAIELDPKFSMAFANRGGAKLAMGLHEAAIVDYNKAIELSPKLAKTYCNRGIAKLGKGLLDDAIADFDKAIERDPSFAQAYCSRGTARHSQGLHDKAIADFCKAIEKDPKLALAWSARGHAKLAEGRYDEAITDCTKAIELDSSLASAYLNRATARYRKDLLDDAIADFTKAIRLDPNNAEAYFNRGTARDVRGLHDDAIADFTKAIELDPKHAGAHCNRGAAYCDQGLFEKAIADFTKTIELDPKVAMAYYNRGSAKDRHGLHDEAIPDLTKAIDLNPSWDLAWLNRCLAYYRGGHHDKAISDFNKAIALSPKLVGAWYDRGLAKAAKGQHDEADSDYKKALDLAPDGHPLRSKIQERLDTEEVERPFREACNLLRAKQYRKAIEKFKSVVDDHPTSMQAVDSAYSIACGYTLLGEKKNALDWLEKSVEMGWEDLAHLEKDSDLESLRKEDRYKKLTEKLRAK